VCSGTGPTSWWSALPFLSPTPSQPCPWCKKLSKLSCKFAGKCVASLELGGKERDGNVIYIDGSTKTWSFDWKAVFEIWSQWEWLKDFNILLQTRKILLRHFILFKQQREMEGK
jgi:hypothetical protein